MPTSSNGRRRALKAAFAAAPLAAGLLVAGPFVACPVSAGPLAVPARAGLVGFGAFPAQFFIDEPEIRLSPRAVVTGLARRGYRDITHPSFDGDTYTLEAENPRGIRVRLVIDAFDGAVLDRARAEMPAGPPPVPPRLVGRPAVPGYGWTDEEPAPPGPVPPRRVERGREPVVASRAPIPGVPAAPGASAASGNPNPLGLNPDASRPVRVPETKPARTTRAADPARTVAPKPAAVPTAPAGPVAPAEGRALEPREAAKAVEPEATKPEVAKSEAAGSEVAGAPAVTTVEKAAEAPQRQVRVIGGVTPPQAAPASSEPGKD